MKLTRYLLVTQGNYYAINAENELEAITRLYKFKQQEEGCTSYSFYISDLEVHLLSEIKPSDIIRVKK